MRDLILTGTITSDQVTGEIAFALAKGYTNIACAKLIGIARDTFYNGRILKYMQALARSGDKSLSKIMEEFDEARRGNRIRTGQR